MGTEQKNLDAGKPLGREIPEPEHRCGSDVGDMGPEGRAFIRGFTGQQPGSSSWTD